MRRRPEFREAADVGNDYAAPVVALSDVLHSREDEFFLFTPALLVTHSEFDRDPVVEFALRSDLPTDQLPFCIDLRKDSEFFFTGLGCKPLPGKARAINWDKRLYCLPAEGKDACVSFISGIIFSNPGSGTFGSVFYYDIPVVDPASSTLNKINVGVFGVRTNKAISFLAPQLSGVAAVATLPATQFVACPAYVTNACAVSLQIPDDPLSMREDKNG